MFAHAPRRVRAVLMWALAVASAAGLLALALPSAGGASVRPTASASSPARLLVPAYFDPPSRSWTTALSAPASAILIANPDSGPGTSAESNYIQLVQRARRSSHQLIGYVHTSDGRRPISAVETDIARWSRFYGVHDIFFDEVSDSAAQLSYYRTVTRYARSHGATLMVLNPGTVPARGYFGLGAIVVTFEDTYAAYQHAAFPAWLRDEPASRQANIVYAVPNTTDARRTLATMHSHGVDVGFVTNAGGANPYLGLPSYYRSETGWLAG